MSETALDNVLAEQADELAMVAGLLWERGWAEFSGGNMSVDVTEWAAGAPTPTSDTPHIVLNKSYPDLANRYFLVTATFSRMRDIAKNWRDWLCLAQVDAEGTGYHLLWRGQGLLRPTSEFNSHLAIHNTNRSIGREARVVVHTHPTELIAMTHLPQFYDTESINRVLWVMMPEAVFVFPDGVGFAPYAMTGTEALEAVTMDVVRKHSVCLWDKHGCLAVGPDVLTAFDILDTANKCAKIFFLCKQAGSDPEGIPPEEVEAIRKALVSGN